MKDAYEVLYQKEADLVRVRQEVECLRITATLLGDDASADDLGPGPEEHQGKPPESAVTAHLGAAATGTDGLLPPTTQHELGFWKSLKSRRF
jgi:hypothetical protein